MSRDRLGVVWAGLAFIGLGITFLFAQWIGWDRIWPIFPLFGGLAFWGGYVASGFREPGLAFVGTGAILVGLFFFGFSLGYWEWAQMSDLWPVPGIPETFRHVQDLFQEPGTCGRNSWRRQGQLVGGLLICP